MHAHAARDRRRLPTRALLSVLLALGCAAAHAQAWPNKPVRIYTETAAGSPVDAVTRSLADRLAKALGQPFVVEARSGGQGVVAVNALNAAPADGYTVLQMNSTAVFITPLLSAKPPFDPLKDLVGVAEIAVSKTALAVHPSIGVDTVPQLLEKGKAQPGKIIWGTAGPASTAYLLMEYLRHIRGIDFFEVPYKSPPAALQGLLAGDVHVVGFAVGPAMAQQRAGKLKVIGVNHHEPSAIFPELPTLRSGGIDVVPLSWFGLFMKAGTPPEIVNALNAAIATIYRDPEFVKSTLHRVGYETSSVTAAPPDAFAKFLREDWEANVKLKRDAKLKNIE